MDSGEGNAGFALSDRADMEVIDRDTVFSNKSVGYQL